MSDFKVTDRKGRSLMHIDSRGKVALARFDDLTDEEIDELARVCHEVTEGKMKIEDVKKFLRFEDEEKFCS